MISVLIINIIFWIVIVIVSLFFKFDNKCVIWILILIIYISCVMFNN